MASRTYFIQTSEDYITLNVSPTSIGIVSTNVQFKKAGGNVTPVGDSNDASGNIQDIKVGMSSDLLNSVLVITSIVNLAGVPENQWENTFNQLSINYQLEGGIDGIQKYNLDNDDKMQIMDNQMIVATKAIKFSKHETN
jgi:hypothetical protein